MPYRVKPKRAGANIMMAGSLACIAILVGLALADRIMALLSVLLNLPTD